MHDEMFDVNHFILVKLKHIKEVSILHKQEFITKL